MKQKISPAVAAFLKRVTKPNKVPVPNRKTLPPELTSIMDEIAKISGTWNPVEIYTPDSKSTEQEKAKFLKAYDRGKKYNPIFKYSYANSLRLNKSREKLVAEMDKIRKIKPTNKSAKLLKTFLIFKLKDDMATCDLSQGIKDKDENKVATALKRKYKGVDSTLIELAENVYSRKTHEGDLGKKTDKGQLKKFEIEYLQNKEFNTNEIKEAFEFVLNKYGILRTKSNPTGYKVKISSDVLSIDVRDKSKEEQTIYIPSDRKMHGVELLGIMAHEIEGHAIQSINGIKLYGFAGGKLKIDDEQLYEGYGLRRETNISEKLFGIVNENPRPYYPFSIKMAENHKSFYEIFDDQFERHLRTALKLGLNKPLPKLESIDTETLTKVKEEAWLVTYRTMRGHIDTTNKKGYAMAKDLGYVRGFQMDRELVENGYGYINESGIIQPDGLKIIAEFEVSEKSLPIHFIDATTTYWEEVLKPQMKMN